VKVDRDIPGVDLDTMSSQEVGCIAFLIPKARLFAQLWTLLERVDPVMANKLHPNDTRKIRRSLEV